MGIGLGSWWRAAAAACRRRRLPRSSGPGILAATCMQTASFESTFPIMGKISGAGTTRRSWPRRSQVRHLLIGELRWIGFRLTTHVDRLPGGAHPVRHPAPPLALLAIPAAVLTGPGLRGADHRLRRHPARTTPASRRSSASSSTRSSCSAAPSSRSTQLPERACSGSPPPPRCTTAWRWCAARSSTRMPGRLAAARRLPASSSLAVDAATSPIRLLRRRLVK